MLGASRAAALGDLGFLPQRLPLIQGQCRQHQGPLAASNSMRANRRSNLALAARSAPSASAPTCRPQLAIANARVHFLHQMGRWHIRIRMLAGLERRLIQLGEFLADLGAHVAHIGPVKAHPAGALAQFLRTGKRRSARGTSASTPAWRADPRQQPPHAREPSVPPRPPGLHPAC